MRAQRSVPPLSWKYWTVRKVSSPLLETGIDFIHYQYCGEIIHDSKSPCWLWLRRVTGTSAPVWVRDNYCRVLIYLFRAATKLGHQDFSHSQLTASFVLVWLRKFSDSSSDYLLFLWEEERDIVNKARMCKYQYQICHVLVCPCKQTNTSQPYHKKILSMIFINNFSISPELTWSQLYFA